MAAYKDTFTVTRLSDGKWRAVQHGFKAAEWFGATASEALANAGKLSDYAAAARDEFHRQEDDHEAAHG